MSDERLIFSCLCNCNYLSFFHSHIVSDVIAEICLQNELSSKAGEYALSSTKAGEYALSSTKAGEYALSSTVDMEMDIPEVLGFWHKL